MALLAAGAAAGALVAALVLAPPPPPGPTVTCRPTLPEQALAGDPGPVLLLWGNSLLFDHHWQGTGAVPVNCARQGQTATAALPATALLPGPAPDTILVAFGSVEAIRAAQSGDPVDAPAFAAAVAAILGQMSARWPDARLIVASVPGFPSAGILRPDDVAALNAALAREAAAADARFLDLGALFAGDPAASYDGIHLSRAAYARWEARLRDLSPG